MSKIRELIRDDKSILVFDIDGVLAKLEFGEYNHYSLNDELWAKSIEEGNSYYTDDLAFDYFKDFFKNKNMSNIYVATKVYNDLESKQKIEFLKRNYNIKEENVFVTNDNNEKLNVLNEIKKSRNIEDDKMIVMIDDTVEVLNNIMDNSNFSTCHISSFIN